MSRCLVLLGTANRILDVQAIELEPVEESSKKIGKKESGVQKSTQAKAKLLEVTDIA